MEKTRCVPIQNEKVAWMPVTEETTQDYTKKTAIMVFKVEHLTKGKKQISHSGGTLNWFKIFNSVGTKIRVPKEYEGDHIWCILHLSWFMMYYSVSVIYRNT